MPHNSCVGTSARASSSNLRTWSGDSTLRPKRIIPPGLISSINSRASESMVVPGSPMKKNWPICSSNGSDRNQSDGICPLNELRCEKPAVSLRHRSDPLQMNYENILLITNSSSAYDCKNILDASLPSTEHITPKAFASSSPGQCPEETMGQRQRTLKEFASPSTPRVFRMKPTE